jgi:predicted nucleic acid-binding Zn ribbon protein
MRSSCIVCGKNTNRDSEYCSKHNPNPQKRNQGFRFDFRGELLMLFCGQPEQNEITDEMLFEKVKDLLVENSQLRREIRIVRGAQQFVERITTL